MEVYSSVTRFILSCNYSSKIIEPVQSRCAVFRFVPLTDKQVHKMLEHIAKKEGLEFGENAEEAIAYVSGGDMRRAINALQGAAIHSKKITEELIYKISSRARPREIREMVDAAYSGKFLDARSKLLELSTQYGLSGSDIILQVYREIVNLEIPEKKKVLLVDRVGEYDFRLVEGANEHIQIEALLAQIMLLGMEKE
jgi:replication factor C small subunit